MTQFATAITQQLAPLIAASGTAPAERRPAPPRALPRPSPSQKAIEISPGKWVKACICCGKEKPIEQFHAKERLRRDGSVATYYIPRCKVCWCDYIKQWKRNKLAKQGAA